MYKKYLIGIGIALLCTIIFYSCDSPENNKAEYNKVLHNQLMRLGPPDVNVTRGVGMDNILTYTWYNKYIGDVIHVLGKPDEIIHDIYTDVEEADRFFKHIRIKPSKTYSPLSYKTILFRYGKYYFKEGHNILMCVYSLNGSPVFEILPREATAEELGAALKKDYVDDAALIINWLKGLVQVDLDKGMSLEESRKETRQSLEEGMNITGELLEEIMSLTYESFDTEEE
ncbi:MAG: hypothetical protein OXI43_20675 [Candidatus Poribacteria bacterium]|nr:hypothetical protein [Candidatus Poribacteria bacterium]